MMDILEILYIVLLTILASGIGTLTGFGTSTIMVPVLLLFIPLPSTLLLVGIIHWFSNVWKIILFREGFNWQLILMFGIPGIITTYIGANILFTVPGNVLKQILGGFLLVYVLFLLFKSSFKVPRNKVSAIGGGALSGFFAGIFGVGGAIRGMFLSAFDLPKAVYISTMGAIAFIIDITRISTYILNETPLTNTLWWGLLLFIPASFLGSIMAKKIVDRIPQQYFRIIIAVFLLLTGLKFLFFPG